MLGKSVLYRVDEKRSRVGIITKVNFTEDGDTVNLSVFSDYEDYTHPLDAPVIKLRNVEIGREVKQCRILEKGDSKVAVPPEIVDPGATVEAPRRRGRPRKAVRQSSLRANSNVHAS